MEARIVRDTKAMEGARRRNGVYQRRLSDQIDGIDAEFRYRNGKIISEKNEAKSHLLDIKSSPNINVVCPNGLSHTEKQQFQKLRRTSLPSVSLDEFDKRLDELKTAARRRLSDGNQEYKKDVLGTPRNPPETNSAIFMKREDISQTLIPRRKLRMKEALKRFETDDIKIKTDNKTFEKRNVKGQMRRKSCSDVPRTFYGN